MGTVVCSIVKGKCMCCVCARTDDTSGTCCGCIDQDVTRPYSLIECLWVAPLVFNSSGNCAAHTQFYSTSCMPSSCGFPQGGVSTPTPGWGVCTCRQTVCGACGMTYSVDTEMHAFQLYIMQPDCMIRMPCKRCFAHVPTSQIAGLGMSPNFVANMTLMGRCNAIAM